MSIFTDILTGGTNSHGVTVDDFNAIATDFLSDGIKGTITSTSGVAPTTGGFAINAQDVPNMSVAVSSGTAYVTGTPTDGVSQRLRVVSDASENVTIAENTTGGTRYDWLYISLDPSKMKDPGIYANDVATLVTSRSTSASTDNGTPPTYGYNLAVITVANGASTIANASVSDNRQSIYISNVSNYAPIGSINAFGGTTAPSGWLLCQGQSLLRASYAALYAVIGTAFGTADATHFNLPDLRGKFARGVDHAVGNDPNSATRTGATGGNTGDNVGSLQDHGVESHTHQFNRPPWTTAERAGSTSYWAPSVGPYNVISGTTGNSSTATGDTRPINVNVEYIIKY